MELREHRVDNQVVCGDELPNETGVRGHTAVHKPDMWEANDSSQIENSNITMTARDSDRGAEPRYPSHDQSQLGVKPYYDDEEEVHPPMSHTEATILLVISVIGVATNTLVLVVILSKGTLRRPSMGMISHQCILDLIKSACSIPYALNMFGYDGSPPAHCNILGALYVVLVTVSFLNILCMVLNDSPTFPDRYNEVLDSHQCVIFGLCMIWFTGCIVNVGSFLTGTPGFNPEIGNCGIVYGSVRSYVTNALWVGFNTFTILICGYQIRKLYKDLTATSNLQALKLVSLVTTMLSINSASKEESEHRRVQRYIQELEHEGLIRLRLFALLLLVLFVQWVPLFLLTIIDHGFTYPREAYKVCIQLAYANACINPIILLVTYKGLRDEVKSIICCQCGTHHEHHRRQQLSRAMSARAAAAMLPPPPSSQDAAGTTANCTSGAGGAGGSSPSPPRVYANYGYAASRGGGCRGGANSC